MGAWQAELVVDGRLARALIGQFPELSIESLRPLSEGWDRSVWLVNERAVFGFPRRASVVPGVEREVAFLPRLAPLLPLAVPVPLYVGQATADYPWPFFGSALLPGKELCDAGLDDAARTAVAIELAGFLRRLHSAEVAETVGADELPLDANRRTEMALRAPKARDALHELDRLDLWPGRGQFTLLLDEAERLPPTRSPAVVGHGDLHFRHLLVEGGRATGVIDWIDLCRADPALDLHVLWSVLHAPARSGFLAAYGPVTEEQLVRARVVAVSLCAELALYGHALGLAAIEREALDGLARAAEP